MKILLFFLLLVLAVFGFSEFLHILKLKTIFPKRRLYSHIVINLQNGIAEKQIVYVCEQMLWHGKNFADFIVLNVENLDKENYELCKGIAEKYDIKYPVKFEFYERM